MDTRAEYIHREVMRARQIGGPPSVTCPDCNNDVLIEELGLPGVYLGPPREYPKERPPHSGHYLTWVTDEEYKAGGYYRKSWYENDVLGFPKQDTSITHWLPMPPPPPSPTRKAE